MENTTLLHQDDAKDKILEGIQDLSKIVAVTLGAAGRNVIIETPVGHKITKDGVTVARNIKFEDKLKDMGVQLVRAVAEKTGNYIGDGTTSSTVLTSALCTLGHKQTKAGFSPIKIKRGLDKAITRFLSIIEEKRLVIDDACPEKMQEKLYHIAHTSANFDHDVAKALQEAVHLVGKEGVVIVEKDLNADIKVSEVEGFRFNSGYISPLFVTEAGRGVWEFTDCAVLVIGRELATMHYVAEVLNYCMANQNMPVLIIASGIEQAILNLLLLNIQRGGLRACFVLAPQVGEETEHFLEDIAVATGATIIGKQEGNIVPSVKPEQLGRANKIVVSRMHTTVIGGQGNVDAIAERIEVISSAIDSGTLTVYQKNYHKMRRATLLGKLAVIKVGDRTDTGLDERLDRVEDAICATKSALIDGYLPGGGSVLYYISKVMEKYLIQDIQDEAEEAIGYKILLKALAEPMKQIIANSGVDANVILSTIPVSEDQKPLGYNVRTGKVEDLLVHNIIDPYEVVKCSVVDAANIAGLFMTTNAAIIKESNEKGELLRKLILQ